MVHRRCPAQLSIFTPAVDDEMRKAIVLPNHDRPHTHPSFPPEKLTWAAELQYRGLINAVGKPGASIVDIDNSKSPIYRAGDAK